MQSERQSVERSGQARAGLIRGILVIVTAFVIGAFVLTQGLGDDADSTAVAASDSPDSDAATGEAAADATSDDNGELAGAEASTDTTDPNSASDGTTDAGEATTTVDTEPAGPVLNAPSEVTVLVLNGAGTKGIAGRGSAVLQAAGYDVLAPKNADVLGPSEVLYTDGYAEEAAAVAAAFGVDAVEVVAVLDLSNPPIQDTQNANIVVVVGEDSLIDV